MRIVINGIAAVDMQKEIVQHILLQHLLENAGLSPRERRIVDLRLADTDFKDIGVAQYVTDMRIRQIHAKAIRKLQKYVRMLDREEHRRARLRRLQAVGR